jgi:hypothetical protein
MACGAIRKLVSQSYPQILWNVGRVHERNIAKRRSIDAQSRSTVRDASGCS